MLASERRAGWPATVGRALVTGTCASVTSSLALALLARAEGTGALRPVNATSHWYNGERAAAFAGFDLRRTGVGYATHHAATVFWALFLERWAAGRPRATGLALLRDALALSAIATGVDYLATPKRFTPGWEFVLSKRAMAAAYAAMALGLAAGTWLTRPDG